MPRQETAGISSFQQYQLERYLERPREISTRIFLARSRCLLLLPRAFCFARESAARIGCTLEQKYLKEVRCVATSGGDKLRGYNGVVLLYPHGSLLSHHVWKACALQVATTLPAFLRGAREVPGALTLLLSTTQRLWPSPSDSFVSGVNLARRFFIQAPCMDNFLPWEVLPCDPQNRDSIYELDPDGQAYGNVYELRKVK